MKLLDAFSMALLTIRRQKTRTALSLVGIVIGSLLLLFSLSSRRGVQDAVARVFSADPRMRQIEVHDGWREDVENIPEEELKPAENLPEPIRSRIQRMLKQKWSRQHGVRQVSLTGDRIAALQAFPHVENVHVDTRLNVSAVRNEQEIDGWSASILANDETLPQRLLAGDRFRSNDEQAVLLNEYVAWNWGYRTPEEMRSLVGQKIQLEYRERERSIARSISFSSGGDIEFDEEETKTLTEALRQLPELVNLLPLSETEKAVLAKAFPVEKTEVDSESEREALIIARELTVAGVIRGPTQEEIDDKLYLGRQADFADFLLPNQTAIDFAMSIPTFRQYGLHNCVVYVDDGAHLKEVTAKIRDVGLNEYSMERTVEFIQQQVRKATLIVSLIAILALLLSAISIANTMIMSVVERTREIGLMKAVGARDWHIRRIFLVEGAALGLIGGLLSLAIALLVRVPVEMYTVDIMERELDRAFTDEHLFQFPLWLIGMMILFSTVVTTLATLFPAWRAARIDPIQALRHD